MSVRLGAVDVRLPLRTLLLVAFVVSVTAALLTILDALVLVFVGIFLALVFEIPVRAFARKTGLSRGLSATIVVIGSAVIVAVLALIVLVRVVGSVRDFLKELPQVVADLRESGELSWLGDSGAAENVQDGAQQVSASIPDAVSAVLGVAGNAFGVLLALTTVLFLALFLLIDMARLREALGSVLMPGDAERWLDVWERITRTVSRWAIGAAIIAVVAGTVQGGTAALLGSSYALALGVIAGLLDLIPNIGATIAGFILVPVVLAEEGVVDAVIMLVVILVYQQVENNLLTPTIQGKATNISAFFVILGVTLFGALLGVLGALVAVPVTASLQIVVAELTAERRKRVAEARAALEAEAVEQPPGITGESVPA
jgi:predicted PurR-regulated permease PerM